MRPRAAWIGVAAAFIAATSLIASDAPALSREQVMVRARSFSYHPWRMRSANQTASCSSEYESVYTPGDYLGLPYDWGGYMTLFSFDQQIAEGAGAGSYPGDGVLSCTAGLDCSGFVSQCWGVGHHTTRNLADISNAISAGDVLPGDVFNEAGYHVSLFSHRLGNGAPVWYEAIGYNVHANVSGGWSWVSGWQPLRHRGITGTSSGDPLGTPQNPIPITSFPFHDSRDTRVSPSDVLDGCGVAPDKPESGPEYVYRVKLTEPGQLTVSVSDDVGVDIDVHLYESLNTSDCVARNDSTFTRSVGCGTYYVVADTYGTGSTRAGPYNLTVTFEASGQPCGSGPAAYDYAGTPGGACAYPDDPSLPFCNPNLGADTCLYTSSSSFCSYACGSDQDCGLLAGGCCQEIAPGERYCLTSEYCATPDGGTGLPDGGTSVFDAGLDSDAGWDAPEPDAGTPPDAGSVPDAGTPPDAGSVPDAGTPPDAGSVPDAGNIIDAGTPPPVDAGAAFDAGARHDAGSSVPFVDAGGESSSASSSGGCQAVHGARGNALIAALFILALWIRRRRRSSS